jgi:hypothetical protein
MWVRFLVLLCEAVGNVPLRFTVIRWRRGCGSEVGRSGCCGKGRAGGAVIGRGVCRGGKGWMGEPLNIFYPKLFIQ